MGCKRQLECAVGNLIDLRVDQDVGRACQVVMTGRLRLGHGGMVNERSRRRSWQRWMRVGRSIACNVPCSGRRQGCPQGCIAKTASEHLASFSVFGHFNGKRGPAAQWQSDPAVRLCITASMHLCADTYSGSTKSATVYGGVLRQNRYIFAVAQNIVAKSTASAPTVKITGPKSRGDLALIPAPESGHQGIDRSRPAK